MNITERKPFTPGEILLEEFIQPAGLNQGELAELMAVPRRRVNEIVNGRRAITPDTAIRLSRVFGTSPEYWLILQQKTALWEELHNPKKQQEYENVQELRHVAA